MEKIEFSLILCSGYIEIQCLFTMPLTKMAKQRWEIFSMKGSEKNLQDIGMKRFTHKKI